MYVCMHVCLASRVMYVCLYAYESVPGACMYVCMHVCLVSGVMYVCLYAYVFLPGVCMYMYVCMYVLVPQPPRADAQNQQHIRVYV